LPREAEGVLRGQTGYRKGKSLWQNGKSGFNAPRARFGFLPLAIAVSVFV
jgi:hypothetical protein